MTAQFRSRGTGEETSGRRAGRVPTRRMPDPPRPVRRFTVVALVWAFVLASCGDPLSGLGDLSQDFVHGDESTTTTRVVDEAGEELRIGVVSTRDIVWYNDGGEPVIHDPAVIQAYVWNRGNGIERFIQASSEEIAVMLAGVQFPAVVPEPVDWVTSQLVYDVASGTVDATESAAFGFWQVEPYTVTRTEGQIAILRVGSATQDDDTTEILAEVADQGLNLRWIEGPWSYELFCRSALVEELCWAMAENMEALADLRGYVIESGATGEA